MTLQVVDMRRYRLWPGRLPEYLERYGSAGYRAQVAMLGPACGWFVTDVGAQNEVVHLWGYPSRGEMEKRRSRLAVDPAWTEVRDTFKGLFAAQETQLLAPVADLPLTTATRTPGLVDIRIYTLRHGELMRFIDLYRSRGAPIQWRHWPDSLGYFQVLSGPLNRIVHIWGHADHAERLQRRRALMANPQWRAYLADALPLFADMASSTATPAPFWQRETA